MWSSASGGGGVRAGSSVVGAAGKGEATIFHFACLALLRSAGRCAISRSTRAARMRPTRGSCVSPPFAAWCRRDVAMIFRGVRDIIQGNIRFRPHGRERRRVARSGRARGRFRVHRAFRKARQPSREARRNACRAANASARSDSRAAILRRGRRSAARESRILAGRRKRDPGGRTAVRKRLIAGGAPPLRDCGTGSRTGCSCWVRATASWVTGPGAHPHRRGGKL